MRRGPIKIEHLCSLKINYEFKFEGCSTGRADGLLSYKSFVPPNVLWRSSRRPCRRYSSLHDNFPEHLFGRCGIAGKADRASAGEKAVKPAVVRGQEGTTPSRTDQPDRK